MDSKVLVSEAKTLVQLMDELGVGPRGAMLVRNPETDTLRLWIVPPESLLETRPFYAQISSIIVDHSDQFSILDAGDIDLRKEDHPAIDGLGKMFRVEGITETHLSGNMFNGFYLPDGILLRMTI